MTEKLPGIGHNGGPALNDSPKSDTKDTGGVVGKRLVSFIERIERLEEEKSALMEDIREVYGESKAVGFDVKTIRKIVKLRKMDMEKRNEEDDLLAVYKEAVGMA